ncbi:hypothetical protein GCK32_004830, partial [Trichostrongylus colubriformis]
IVELADPEISKNAFERTLLMEERTMVLKQMQESRSGGNNSAGVREVSPLVTAERKVSATVRKSGESKGDTNMGPGNEGHG